MTVLVTILIATAAFVGVIIGMVYAYRMHVRAQQMLGEARSKWDSARKDIEAEKREAHIQLKDELYKKRTEFDLDMKRERAELERFQIKLNGKYEVIEKKEERLEELANELQQKERSLSRAIDAQRAHEQKLKKVYDDLTSKLEAMSGMTREQARAALFEALEDEVILSNQKYIQKIEEEARALAKEKAQNIVVTAMQRYTADQVAPNSSGAVHLPNDEMKGRIIGKEGRNIKALETGNWYGIYYW